MIDNSDNQIPVKYDLNTGQAINHFKYQARITSMAGAAPFTIPTLLNKIPVNIRDSIHSKNVKRKVERTLALHQFDYKLTVNSASIKSQAVACLHRPRGLIVCFVLIV